MSSQHPNVPGFDVRVKDGTLVSPRTAPDTGNVTIIEYGLWGPVNEGRTFDNAEDGESVFGKQIGAFGDTAYTSGFNGNALVKAMKQVVQAGCRNVTLVRPDFGGVAAETTLFYSQVEATPAALGAALVDGEIVLTFAALPAGVIVGQAAWQSAVPGVIYTVDAIHTVNKTITVKQDVAIDPLPAGAVDAWTFSPGLKLSAAYPGKIGGSIKFKIEDITPDGGDTTKRLDILAPNELGGRVTKFSSARAETLNDLMFAVNGSLMNLVALDLVYAADGTDAFADIRALLETGNASNPLGWLNIGVALDAADDTLVVQAGTNCKNDEVLGVAMNPYGSTVTAAQRRKWYAEVLGSCLKVEHRDKTLPLLRGIDTGVVVVPGLYLDDLVDATGAKVATKYNLDTAGTWSEETYGSVDADNCLQWLLDFVHLQRRAGILANVAIGFSPLTRTTRAAIRDRVEFMEAVEFMEGTLVNLDSSTEVVDAGKYLKVFGGPQRIVADKEIGYDFTSGALQYAALMVSLHPNTSPSQKPMPSGSIPAYKYTLDEINALSGGQGSNDDGGAYIVTDTRRTPDVVNLAVTAANRQSDFAKEHNCRVTEAAIQATRNATAMFLGNPFGFTERMAMETAIQTSLDDLVDQRVLFGGKDVGYKYFITQTNAEGQLGYVNIFLQVKANPELDWINLTVEMFM